MQHVEAVIKMLDPAFNLRRIAVKRRQPNPWFRRGTLSAMFFLIWLAAMELEGVVLEEI